MCLASDYIKQIEVITTRYKDDYEKLVGRLSHYDKLVADIYHKIETANFNACEGYYLSKNLQEVLQKRRIVKDEMSRLNMLNQTLNLNKLTSSLDNSRQCVAKSKKKSHAWQKNWKNTYSLEEVLH
jgi:hypothetical protein